MDVLLESGIGTHVDPKAPDDMVWWDCVLCTCMQVGVDEFGVGPQSQYFKFCLVKLHVVCFSSLEDPLNVCLQLLNILHLTNSMAEGSVINNG